MAVPIVVVVEYLFELSVLKQHFKQFYFAESIPRGDQTTQGDADQFAVLSRLSQADKQLVQ